MNYELVSVAELTGHEERVWHAAWNPKEPLLATCSADRTVRLYAYSHADGAIKFIHIHTIETGHTKSVRYLSWHPSGKTLAVASFDSTVSMWERGDGEDFEDDGSVASSSSDNASSSEWDCVATIEGPESEIKGVGYSPSGSLFATCSRDKSVWIWEVLPDHDHETISVLMGQHTQDVKCVAWHPIEEILASGSYDDTIKLYIDDPSDDWYDYATLSGHQSTVWSLSFSPCGKYLASGSDDLTVRIWSAGKQPTKSEWECVHLLRQHSRPIYSVSWGLSGSRNRSLGRLASSGSDGIINIWDIGAPDSDDSSFVSSRSIIKCENAHGVHDVNAVAWCPIERHKDLLVSCGDDGIAKVWRVVEK